MNVKTGLIFFSPLSGISNDLICMKDYTEREIESNLKEKRTEKRSKRERERVKRKEKEEKKSESFIDFMPFHSFQFSP